MSSVDGPLARRPRFAATVESVGSHDAVTQNFRGGRKPGPHDVFIAVMGVTGSGKSSFISLCSGEKVPIGHALGACTSTVDVYAYEMSPDRTVYLLDTPGFDDTSRSDTQVLSEIATWLGDSYRNKILLSGILYLHRITDIRMQGSAKRNLIMFRQLCGPDALKKVLLVTTMWDKIPSDHGVQREKELVETPEFWGWMLEKGSSCHRHHNTDASAKDLIHRLARHNTPVATNLQKQLVDEGLNLDQTSAGREVQHDLNKEKERWARERREIEVQLQAAIQARDLEQEQIMREERDRYTKMVQKVEDDTNDLRSTMENLLAKRDLRVAEMEKQMRQMEDERAELLEDLRQARRRESRQDQNQHLSDRWSDHDVEFPWEKEDDDYDDYDDGKDSYCLSMRGKYYTCIGPHGIWCGNFQRDGVLTGSICDFISIGEDHESRRNYIYREAGGFWVRSSKLTKQYPHLGEKLRSMGLHNLDKCVLGAGQSYYARWNDGRWSAWAAETASEFLEKMNRRRRELKWELMSVALGYGGAYVIAGRFENYKPHSGHSAIQLMGYYPGLARTLRQRTVSIIALALNPANTTDYIMIWMDPREKIDKLDYYCSDEAQSRSIETWWDRICDAP